MQIRLEKIIPEKRQHRFYVMQVTRTLFGEWCLIREWGRIGSAGGQRMTDYVTSREEAQAAHTKLSKQKCRRGYNRCKIPYAV
ncbi:WGR domain-containing protein [Roseovarius aestuarii]|uniref:WGR domain protein n=1 Tax=Roseovarius aestuarii TaxID=475083 RepID=A0A1X7BW08_9RHOB|nr:WGR domain-containing protein [Roseovarius aestuarii]SMC13818.1 WGR domain protein [Roseovarius aestuarii]